MENDTKALEARSLAYARIYSYYKEHNPKLLKPVSSSQEVSVRVCVFQLLTYANRTQDLLSTLMKVLVSRTMEGGWDQLNAKLVSNYGSKIPVRLTKEEEEKLFFGRQLFNILK